MDLYFNSILKLFGYFLQEHSQSPTKKSFVKAKAYDKKFQVKTDTNVIFRLAIIRRNMPIEQHRRTDIFGAKSTGIMSYEVGGVDSGSSWPFGQVTMHEFDLNQLTEQKQGLKLFEPKVTFFFKALFKADLIVVEPSLSLLKQRNCWRL